MHIPVLIEPVPGSGFRARGVEPFGLTAEGATTAEAVQRLGRLLEERLAAGVQVVSLELPSTAHPLAPFAGMFQNDPLAQEWQQILVENRRLAEADPDLP